VLSSRDDPFVPAAMLERDVKGRPGLTLSFTAAGGHVGYLVRRRARLVFWAADAILDALEPTRQAGVGRRAAI
jgi:predicted alpha/beta-fold hydrolase